MSPHTALMDAMALNATQARLLYNPTAEIDSALEHLIAAARASTGSVRDHVLAAAALLAQIQNANHAERALEHDAAAQINGTTARDPHTYRRLAKTLGPALSDLTNPMITGRARMRAMDIVHGVIASAPAERLGTRERPNLTLRNELGRGKTGARRYGALLDVLDGVRA